MPSLTGARVVELRRYTLVDGHQVDVLYDLFRDHLIEGQRAAGMCIGGIYRDADAPHRFVWWRGFRDMEARRQALEAFYDGPMWAEYRDAANRTMVDSDDVLLLQWAHQPPDIGRQHDTAVSSGAAATLIVRHEGDRRHAAGLARRLRILLEGRLGTGVGTWLSEPAANDFPRLPVRTEPSLVLEARFSAPDERDAALRGLSRAPEWSAWLEELHRRPNASAELMRLDSLPANPRCDHHPQR